jgi:predicted DsbA family dithiol-disulfide isomerase
MATMNIEIWSDVVCPWCYIGKRRFETALANFAHRDEVQVTWRSFELNPNSAPQEEGNLNEMLVNKYGVTPERAAAMNAQVTQLASQEGLEYHLEKARPGNTFNAHRLIHLAARHNMQDAVKERLMYAYFTEGKSIGDPETLAALGIEMGLPADEVRSVLASDQYRTDVRADQQRAAGFGIRGVPFFVINEQFGISGAQSPDVILETLEEAWRRSNPLKVVGAADNDAVCSDESCAV